jgi:hypothetical protein
MGRDRQGTGLWRVAAPVLTHRRPAPPPRVAAGVPESGAAGGDECRDPWGRGAGA